VKQTDKCGERHLGLPTITRVAVSDTGWLVLLLPLGLVFRMVLVLASAYYRLHRRSRILSSAYVLGVVAGLGWLGMCVARLWRE
jgi:hypothetical protein